MAALRRHADIAPRTSGAHYGLCPQSSQSADLGTIPENLRTLPHLWLPENRQICFHPEQIPLTPDSLIHVPLDVPFLVWGAAGIIINFNLN